MIRLYKFEAQELHDLVDKMIYRPGSRRIGLNQVDDEVIAAVRAYIIDMVDADLAKGTNIVLSEEGT